MNTTGTESTKASSGRATSIDSKSKTPTVSGPDRLHSLKPVHLRLAAQYLQTACGWSLRQEYLNEVARHMVDGSLPIDQAACQLSHDGWADLRRLFQAGAISLAPADDFYAGPLAEPFVATPSEKPAEPISEKPLCRFGPGGDFTDDYFPSDVASGGLGDAINKFCIKIKKTCSFVSSRFTRRKLFTKRKST